MASKLKQLQSKASQASEFLSKNGTAYHKQLMEQNKQYVQEPPTVEKCNELSKQLLYTRLASIPKRNESFWKELDFVKNIWKNRQELHVEVNKPGLRLYLGLNALLGFVLVRLLVEVSQSLVIMSKICNHFWYKKD